MDSVAPATATFSERAFYLREFSGRTVAIAGSASPDPDDLARAVQELTGAGTRVVVMGSARDPLDKVVDGRWLQAGADRLEAEAWRALRSVPCLGIALDPGRPLLADVRDLAARLGVFKLVLLDAEGGMLRPNGRLASFVHLEELWALLERHPERAPLLREVEATLLAGVPSVNVCPPDGLWDELFTYAGSGTLFTRERYISVRRLGIDDFDAAADLLARGVAEGYLAPRSAEALDHVLAHSFGAFVEGRYLAGICALLPLPETREAEIAALYAMTRFLGESVGAHLVGFALERGRELGLRRIFACTTSDRAAAFFSEQGFEPVASDALPASKWASYDPERRASVRCFARSPTG